MAIPIYVLYRKENGKPIFLDWYGTPTLAHVKGDTVHGGDYKILPISVPDKATMRDVDIKARKEVSKLELKG
jgi:hypothetical protein